MLGSKAIDLEIILAIQICLLAKWPNTPLTVSNWIASYILQVLHFDTPMTAGQAKIRSKRQADCGKENVLQSSAIAPVKQPGEPCGQRIKD
jgi:hypothetical protein